MAKLTDAERQRRITRLQQARDHLRIAQQILSDLPESDQRHFDRAFDNYAAARPGIINRIDALLAHYEGRDSRDGE